MRKSFQCALLVLFTSTVASTAAAQTVYIDCTITLNQRPQTWSFAVGANGADSLSYYDSGTTTWVSPCKLFFDTVPCTVSVNSSQVRFSATLNTYGLVLVNAASIDRTSAEIVFTSTNSKNPGDNYSATGKCVRGQNPATKPRAF